MKKIKINDSNIFLYYEKLVNKLEIFFVPLDDKKRYTISFTTKYGNKHSNFKVNNKKFSMPSGIAHFLEHKLFESDDVNPFSYFAKSGTDVNAGTSSDYTNYYCMGSSNFYNNLRYLLKLVTTINITDENVEKEKGIILQEERMVYDSIDNILLRKTLQNSFHNDTVRNEVVGTKEDIKSITKDDLINCYNTFYRPDNMFIVVVGKFNKEKALKIIKEELKDFKNPDFQVEKISLKEPDNVLKKTETIYKDIAIPRISINYKLNKKSFQIDDYHLNYYLSAIHSLLFGDTTLFYEECIEKDLFVDLYRSLEDTKYHKLYSLYCTTNNPNELIKKVEHELKNINIQEKDFERKKKVWISDEIKDLDNAFRIRYSIFSDIIKYEEYKNEKIKDIKSLKYSELQDVIKSLNFENRSIVKVLPKK